MGDEEGGVTDGQGKRASSAKKLYGSKESSLPQKLVMQLASWGALAGVGWFLFDGGREALARALGTEWPAASHERAALLFACSAIYTARLVVTQFYLVKRAMPWGECVTIAVWIGVIHATMIGVGGRNPAPLGVLSWLGVALYLLGSYFNTGSELGRHLWKKRPENQGKLYTEGLFKYAMHINYFGDFTLFTGFALVTGSLWAFAIPLTMACLFNFVNIPMLDAYLAEHYGRQFDAYAAKTKKFFPFVY